MRMVVGVIGHVDHGKTALVRALTGMDTDRLPEEKRRGISIALGFAHLTSAQGAIDFIDMPGHERFVRTMVAGAGGMGAVLLVVAANEGIKPQTREHVDIAGLLGVTRAIVAVSKADLVAPHQAELVLAEAAALAREAGLAVAACCVTSARDNTGLATLTSALLAMADGDVPGADDGFAYLPLDRAFSLAGHGTVVTGTLRHGQLAVGDTLELVPVGRTVRVRVRVRGMQVHGGRVTCARPGQRVAVNLRDVAAHEVGRGLALATPGALMPATWLTVSVRTVEAAPALENGVSLMLLTGTDEVEARLRLLEGDALQAGGAALAQLRLTRPVAVPARNRFVLRLASPPRTVGGGVVIDPAATRLRRNAPAVMARLRRLDGASPETIVRVMVEDAGPQGAMIDALGRLAGISRAQVIAALQGQTVRRANEVILTEAAFAAVQAAVLSALEAEPEGLTMASLPARAGLAAPAAIDLAVTELVAKGVAHRADGAVLLRRIVQARASQDALSARRLADALRQGGLSPPEPARLAPPAAARRLVDHLVRAGIAVRAPDPAQGREIIFHADAVAEARRILAPLLKPPGLLVTDAGAALGISRKYCVPLLEHLDAIRFTRRVADRRVLAQD